MIQASLRRCRFGLPLRALGLALIAALAGLPARAQTVAYDQLAPLLAARCVMCHAGAAAPLGLRLDSLDGLLKGSQKGPVVKAGDAAGSELIKRLKGQSQPRMPMTGPPYLSDAEIGLFERWVAGGLARGDAGIAAAAPATLPRPPLRPGPGEAVTYSHVAPIFATRCAKCHTAQGGLMGPPPEGLVLTSWEDTLDSRDRARVVPGQPAASELLRRIRGQARPRMPFDGPPYLSEDEITLISEWIRQGAKRADGQAAAVPVGAKVRLHGMLQAPGQLDDLALAPGGQVRREGRGRRGRGGRDEPAAGAGATGAPGAAGGYVELRGWLRADGSIEVERLRER